MDRTEKAFHTPTRGFVCGKGIIHIMNNDESTQDSAAPQVVRIHKKARILILAIAIAIGALVLGVVGAVNYYPPASAVWSALTIPPELKNATFVATDENGQSIRYRVSGGTYKIQDSAAVSEYALSPDGRLHVFSEQFQGEAGDRNPENFRIVLVNNVTGERYEHGIGFAPFFVDNVRLIWFTPAGLVLRDLGSNETTMLYEQPLASTHDFVAQSLDRTLIVWRNGARRLVTVYRVGENEGIVAQLERRIPPVFLGNTAFYIPNPTPAGTEIWKHQFSDTEPVLVHTIPSHLGINSMTL